MDDRTTQRARRLADLHRGPRPLVLPTVWDSWSARLAEQAGFGALTVGSHPLADSLGEADGEVMSFETVLGAVRRITAAVDLPVSVDLESGYGVDPVDLVAGLLEAGGVGVNLEDTVHAEGGRLRTADEHAALIAAVRAAADTQQVALVINGRTDLFKNAGGDPAPHLAEGISRLQALVEAGADSVYPVAIQQDEHITVLVEAMSVPVNITAKPEADDFARLTALGVGRISFGPRLQAALSAYTADLLQRWR